MLERQQGAVMCRINSRAGVILVAVAGTWVASCTTTAPMLPKQFVDLSPAVEPGLVEKQFGQKIAQVGFLPEPRFEDLIEDEPGYYSAMTVVTILNHLGSHHDAPRHLSRSGRSSDQVPLDRFYGRARIFDFRPKGRNEPLLPADFMTESIKPDEIVIAYVGYTPPVDSDSLPTYPYLSGEAARYLASLKIKAFATDMPGLMSIVNSASAYETASEEGNAYPEHTALLEEDIVVIEGLANLEDIVGLRDVIFVGFPIKLKDGNGAPLRAVALIY
jgi:kynurenine formamidase